MTELLVPGLDSIDKVPIQLLIGGKDEICPSNQAEDLYDLIKSPKRKFRVEDSDHRYVATSSEQSLHENYIDMLEYQFNDAEQYEYLQIYEL